MAGQEVGGENPWVPHTTTTPHPRPPSQLRSPAPSPPLAGLGGARGPVGGAALPDLFRSRSRSESPRSVCTSRSSVPRRAPHLCAACRAPACWPRSAARCSAPPASSPAPVSDRAALAPPLRSEVRRGALPPPPLLTNLGWEARRGRGATSPRLRARCAPAGGCAALGLSRRLRTGEFWSAREAGAPGGGSGRGVTAQPSPGRWLQHNKGIRCGGPLFPHRYHEAIAP